MRHFSIISIQLTFSNPENIIVLSYDDKEHFLLTLKFSIFHFSIFHLITATDVQNNKNNSQVNPAGLPIYLIHTFRDIFSLPPSKKVAFQFGGDGKCFVL